MRKLLGLMAVLVVFTGCKYNYNSEFEQMAAKEGWSKKRVLANLGESYYDRFLEEDTDGELTVNFAVLPKEWVRKNVEQAADDIADVLNYKNERNAAYADFFGVRPFLEKEEKRLRVIQARVRAAELHDEFKKLTGDMVNPHTNNNYYGPSAYGNGYGQKSEKEEGLKNGFVWKIYLPKDLNDLFDFSLDKIKVAKEKGHLKVIERSGLFISRKYDHKEQDVANLDDPNAFVWVPKSFALELIFHKIVNVEKPANNNFDYVEVYRITNVVTRKRESLPCIKAFSIYDGVVLLVDTDKEGEPGYGSPDHVSKVYGLGNSRDVLSNKSLMEMLFQDRRKRDRILPEKTSLFVEFAKVGSPVDIWEDAPGDKGWPWPLFKYKNALKNNYNVKLEWEKRKNGNNGPTLTRKLKCAKKEWTNSSNTVPCVGAIVEHYRLKAPYDGKLISAIILHLQDTKRVEFVTADGVPELAVIVPGVNKFIEDKPYAIEYTEGERRWRIEKRDGAKVFNKRKRISLTNGRTGIY